MELELIRQADPEVAEAIGLELERQRVAARERTDRRGSVGVVYLAHVPGIPEVVHHLLRVIPHRRSTFVKIAVLERNIIIPNSGPDLYPLKATRRVF